LEGFYHLSGLGGIGVPSGVVHQFFSVKQGPFSIGGALEAGVASQFRPVEAGLEHQAQENLSRDGPADSLVPVGDLILPVRGQGRHQDHIRQHEAAAGLQDPVGLFQGLGLIQGQV
jgi:hypothetical protein